MSSLGVKGRTKSYEANECDQQFRENDSMDIGKSQRLQKKDNARMNKVSARGQGLAKINQKVRISWYFESAETDLHIAENACCIGYANTWLLKWVHWLLISGSLHCSASDYGCDDKLELDTAVSRAGLRIMGIHTWVASKPKIPWLPATLRSTRWMDHCEACHRRFEAIPKLDPVDVEEAYSHLASHYHIVQWHVRPHWWRDASFGQEQDLMERRLVLRCEVSSTYALQILRWRDSYNGHASHLSTYPQFFLEVAIV